MYSDAGVLLRDLQTILLNSIDSLSFLRSITFVTSNNNRHRRLNAQDKIDCLRWMRVPFNVSAAASARFSKHSFSDIGGGSRLRC